MSISTLDLIDFYWIEKKEKKKKTFLNILFCRFFFTFGVTAGRHIGQYSQMEIFVTNKGTYRISILCTTNMDKVPLGALPKWQDSVPPT